MGSRIKFQLLGERTDLDKSLKDSFVFQFIGSRERENRSSRELFDCFLHFLRYECISGYY